MIGGSIMWLICDVITKAQYKLHLLIEALPFEDPQKYLIWLHARDKHQTLNGITVLDIVVGMECANRLLR